MTPQHLIRSTRGASLTEYGILVTLLGSAAIAAVFGLGGEIRSIFGDTSSQVNTGIAQARPGVPPVAPGTTPEEEEEPSVCFVDESGDLTRTFAADDPTTCFDLEGGNDTVAFEASHDLTITGTGGWKALRTGNGDNSITLGFSTPLPASVWQLGSLTDMPLSTGAGNDTIALTGASTFGISTGAGNDSISAMAIPSVANRAGHHKVILPGAGTNTITAQCGSDPNPNDPVVIVSEGDDSVVAQSCAAVVMPASTNGTISTPSLDVVLQDSPYFSYRRPQGLVPSSTTISGRTESFGFDGGPLINQSGYTTGPISIDVDAASTQFMAENLEGTTTPVDVSFSARSFPDEPISHARFNADYPHPSWNLNASDYALTTATLRFYAGRADQGIPNITIDAGGALHLHLRANVETRVCWPAVLSNPSLGTSEEVDCSTRQHFMDAANLAPWTRLEVTDPSTAQVHQINFNGGEGRNGADLNLIQMIINND